MVLLYIVDMLNVFYLFFSIVFSDYRMGVSKTFVFLIRHIRGVTHLSMRNAQNTMSTRGTLE